MKTLLLVHKDLRDFGGYERNARFIQRALNADVVNIKRGDDFYPDDYDYFVAVDDPSVYRLPLDRPHTAFMTTPRRSLYDMYYMNPWYIRAATWPLRVRDRYMMSRVRDFVANSHNTRIRIYKTFQKEAEVIYPCIECDKFYHGEDKGYWLAAGRIAKWKRIPMIIDAFREMPDERLIIYGAPASLKDAEMVKNLPKNIRWETGEDEGLIERYAHCRGVITMGIDEDFGYVPLEAMASGKWVIAPCEGGYKETIKPMCGSLINPTKESLIRVVSKYDDKFSWEVPYTIVRNIWDYKQFAIYWKNHAEKIVNSG